MLEIAISQALERSREEQIPYAVVSYPLSALYFVPVPVSEVTPLDTVLFVTESEE